MTSDAEYSLSALRDFWKELPGLCGKDWPEIEGHLERVLVRLYAAVEPDPDAFLAAQLQIIFKDHPDVLERLSLSKPVTRSGVPRTPTTSPGIRTRGGSGTPIRTRGGSSSPTYRGSPSQPRSPGAELESQGGGRGEVRTRGGLTEPIRGPGGLASPAGLDFAEDPRERVATMAGLIRDLVGPPVVTRYVDVSCPDRVSLHTPRFTLVVRLLTSASSNAAAVMSLVESGKVHIRLEAPGFEILGPSEHQVSVTDSPPVVFDLRPSKAGRFRIIIDFSQNGNCVGTVVQEIECAEADGSSFPPRHTSLRSDPAAKPPDIVLLVSTQGSRLTFTLMQEGGAWGRNFTSRELRDPAAFATRLYHDLTGLVLRSEPVADAHEVEPTEELKPREIDRSVRKLGQNLWNDLFPKEFRELYANSRGKWHGRSMLLLSDEPHIPWELVWPYGEGYADDQPWCCTFQMTRWLRLDDQGSGSEGPPGELWLRSLALLAPMDSGLPSAHVELDSLSKLLSSRGVKVLTPPATLDEVMNLLEQGGYDWLHVAAHGKFHNVSPDGHSALWLEGLRPFTPASIVGPEVEAHIRKARPAFVFNACEGGRQGHGLTGLAGWASRLVGRGAGLFAGALWEITDDAALAFVSDFYARLLDGATVGEALRQARIGARKSGDPTWLAYSVYAHPNAKLLLAL
jgi:hypothetical protein